MRAEMEASIKELADILETMTWAGLSGFIAWLALKLAIHAVWATVIFKAITSICQPFLKLLIDRTKNDMEKYKIENAR